MNQIGPLKKLLDHAFWTEYLCLDSEHIKALSLLGTKPKANFLNEVVKGFYPLSKLSAPVFEKLSNVIEPPYSDSASFIYETELGLHPLVKNTVHYKVPHAEQFFLLCNSLIDDVELEKPDTLTKEFFDKINIKEAPIEKILGIVSVIEYNGPNIIYFLDDFVAQWKIYNKRSSQRINSHFIQEHGLIEGNDGSEQHISMVQEILEQYEDKINHNLYIKSMNDFVEVYHDLLDAVCLRMESVLKGY